MLLPLLPCCSVDHLGWQLLNQPFLFYIFSTFISLSTRVSPVSRTVSTTILRVLRFFAFLPPSQILFSFPFLLSSYLFPSPLLSSLPSPLPSPFPSGYRLRVPTPVPVPAPPRPRSRPHSRPALLRSPPPPFPFPLRPCPHDRLHPRYRLCFHPRLQSRPRPRSLLPVSRIGYPHGTMRLYRRRAFRMGLSGKGKVEVSSAWFQTA